MSRVERTAFARRGVVPIGRQIAAPRRGTPMTDRSPGGNANQTPAILFSLFATYSAR